MTVKTLKLLFYCWGDGTAIENTKNWTILIFSKKITYSQKNNRPFQLFWVGKYFGRNVVSMVLSCIDIKSNG